MVDVTSTQLSLFGEEYPAKLPVKMLDAGTFKDSMRAPVHSWFRYPAGYSYKFVEHLFEEYQLKPGHWVYDPFSGSGTTLLCAQQTGLNGYGVEAHSFVHWVAQTKLNRHYPINFNSQIISLLRSAHEQVMSQRDAVDISGKFPELVYKCYHPRDLNELYLLREFIATVEDEPIRDFLKLALTDTLRSSAAAGTGWPYIAPRKNTGDKPARKAMSLFEQTVWKMVRDLELAKTPTSSTIHNVLGDSRQKQDLEERQIDLALTSPPYLNNYDYADRTRLETYFWGITHSWGDISREYRAKLLVAATTQVTRRLYEVETVLDREIQQIAPEVYQTVQDAVLKLASLRPTKGGKKDYDLMVALYFNGIINVLREAARVIRGGGTFCLVLGDSAPYGVHIATENLIGQLGVALGFKRFQYEQFRKRGEKWKENPQRHTVSLREGVVILTR